VVARWLHHRREQEMVEGAAAAVRSPRT